MGLFNKSTVTSSATGAANTPATLWSESVSSGAVNNGNAMQIRLEVSGYGAGQSGWVKPQLNGKDLYDSTVPVIGDVNTYVDILVWRTGNFTADVTTTVALGGETFLASTKSVTGLAFTSSQNITVVGQSNMVGGVILQRAGETH